VGADAPDERIASTAATLRRDHYARMSAAALKARSR
jgi:hypothetical protein